MCQVSFGAQAVLYRVPCRSPGAPQHAFLYTEDVEDAVDVEFTYSVSWKESNVPFDKRMDKYRRYQFLKQHLEVGCKSLCV